ncbi:hypothetical protein HS041_29020 [Planomonospora sp. ID67723]|uniref:hypothetical protein n=1 Tax=Planomonospora sp. ID67723 TaxID=2738134 RepID=UPI0018C3BCE6|nr:hypothetical protein [Planomonospora sp. ID67723]MBG0831762.1 hypothetical protein [Planomonospora sp. ID67723]
MLKKVRQSIESPDDTLKSRCDPEAHGGRSFAGVATRLARRIPATATAIWRNHATNVPITRSPTG